MDLRGLIALVTGAAGFVGANLVRALLAAGTRVHVIVRPGTDPWRLQEVLPRLHVHEVDLRAAAAVRDAVAAAAPDVIVHLAKHRGDPAGLDYRAAYHGNFEATLNLLEAAAARSLLRFVHAGSSLEYDLLTSPLREGDAPAPRTAHGVTKAAATLLCQHVARQDGLPAVVLRFFTVYGPWEAPIRFVPTLMTAALEGQTLRVTQPGLRHDWIFVEDVVDACVRSFSTKGVDGEVINIGTGTEATNEELVQLVADLCGHEIPCSGQEFEKRPWDTAHWVADVTKARDVLGWRASHDLRSGLELTLAWFREHRDLYRAAVHG